MLRGKGKLYSIERLVSFLDETKGRSVILGKHFADVARFVVSAQTVLKKATLEEIDNRKRFRLKKHVFATKK